MNILFISDRKAEATSGGVERAVGNLARYFQQRGNACFQAYYNAQDDDSCETVFRKQFVIQGDLRLLKSFIVEEKIDIVISNLMNKDHIRVLMPALNSFKTETPNTKYCFYYHSYPGNELRCLPPQFLLKRFCHLKGHRINSLTAFVKSMAIIVFPNIIRSHLRNKYLRISDNESNLIVLSESYKQDFASLIQVPQIPPQWHSISNALSFPSVTTSVRAREKTVLIVARLEEDAKRLTKALKIWERLTSAYDVSEWKLVIVGDGIDRPIYERIVAKREIPGVFFEGRQNSLPYYIKSSIFMMTSAYEGFPMSILETLQCGCVPIAFDTFSAIRDLIEDGTNGYIVENDHFDDYVEKLHFLMKNEDVRAQMAENGMQSVQRYSVDNIMKQWYDLFEKLRTEN